MVMSIILLIVLSLIAYFLFKGVFNKIRFFILDKFTIYKLFCWGVLNNKYCPEYIPKSCSYEIHFVDTWRNIVHFPGLLLYYGIILYSIIFLFFYHPFEDGFYVKDNSYQVGETIVVYDNEEEIKLSAVVTDIRDNGGYIISINGKTEKTYTKEDEYSKRGTYVPKGRYIPSTDNFFIQMNQSVFLFFKNLFT